MSLKDNPKIAKSIRRLQNLGLVVDVVEQSPDWCIVVVDSRSIIKAMKRIIERNITYPSSLTLYSQEADCIEIHFWRGDMPVMLKREVDKLWREGEMKSQ